jgi:hypothetical protein
MCVEGETILVPTCPLPQSVLPVSKNPICCARTPGTEYCRRPMNVHAFLDVIGIYVIFLFIFNVITGAPDICQGPLRPQIFLAAKVRPTDLLSHTSLEYDHW